MDRTTVAQARREDYIGKTVRLQGWVRTRRDSKGGFSFIELNDGSCLGNVQVLRHAHRCHRVRRVGGIGEQWQP